MPAKTTKSRTVRRSAPATTTQSPSAALGQMPLDPSGPNQTMPDPEMLARYEKVIPGSATRILALAERQTAHRLRLQKFTTVSKFILALAAGALGGILLLTGSELAGLMIVLADIVACVWTKSSQNA